jgi:hypothetical protein
MKTEPPSATSELIDNTLATPITMPLHVTQAGKAWLARPAAATRKTATPRAAMAGPAPVMKDRSETARYVCRRRVNRDPLTADQN